MRIPEIYYDVKKFLKRKNEMDALYQELLERNKAKQVQYWNWWEDKRAAYWLERFMESRGILKNTDKIIALCSVFGEREVLERVNADVRIFFSGENLHNGGNSCYADYMLSGKKTFDTAIGFDEFDADNYLRFPLWLMYLFAPDATEEDIRRRCEELRHPFCPNKRRFCTLIARADVNGLRTEIYNGLKGLGQVDCPSGLFHNDDSLVEKFGDDKVAYMQQYQFNICPENTNAMGYTTEKVFEAIVAGCVPIYWGSYNNPEPNILNPEAIIFWDKENGGKNAIAQIRELCANPKQLETFIHQPRLLPNAEEEIVRMMRTLYNSLKNIVG